jgi:hypothetical protein
VKPDIFRNIDCAGETGPVVDLPIGAGVENGRVLDGVGQSRFVLPQINPFAVGAVVIKPELNPEKPALSRGGDIHIDYPVAHFKILEDCRAAIEEEALAALIFRHLGFLLQLPSRGVRGNGERRRSLRIGRGLKKNNEGAKSDMSKQKHKIELRRALLLTVIRKSVSAMDGAWPHC